MATIKNVTIDNWHPPGEEWWDEVASKPDEPLIEATFSVTVSHAEYHRLINTIESLSEPRLLASALRTIATDVHNEVVRIGRGGRVDLETMEAWQNLADQVLAVCDSSR